MSININTNRIQSVQNMLNNIRKNFMHDLCINNNVDDKFLHSLEDDINAVISQKLEELDVTSSYESLVKDMDKKHDATPKTTSIKANL
jgi:predicted transcriptional regulator YheO